MLMEDFYVQIVHMCIYQMPYFQDMVTGIVSMSFSRSVTTLLNYVQSRHRQKRLLIHMHMDVKEEEQYA